MVCWVVGVDGWVVCGVVGWSAGWLGSQLGERSGGWLIGWLGKAKETRGTNGNDV